MSFKDIAAPFIALGIPVFPLLPKVKEPPSGMAFLEEATTDSNKVEQWNTDNPDFNVALLADGEFGFLEFDIVGGMEQACADTGQTRPKTREQKSGGGYNHFIFKMDDRSRALRNRSVSLAEPCYCANQEPQKLRVCNLCPEIKPHHHHEWFSFRCHNKYLVGAGSLHPSGNYYETLQDKAPAIMPAWLVEWVEEHSKPSKKGTGPASAKLVSEDFDFDDLMEHFGISIDHVKDGVWHVPTACPGVGKRHRHSKETAFYWDGSSLGWSCFAQGCPTSEMGIGQLLKFLHQTNDPYPAVIWEDEELPLDELMASMGFEFSDDEPVPLPKFIAQGAAAMAQVVPPGKPRARRILIGQIDADSTTSRMIGITADQVIPKRLRWLWEDKIPMGKLTLWTGKPDNGKSLSLLDLTARITRGTDFPDGSKNTLGPRVVIYAASEDDPQDTLVPRLMAAGADLTKVVFPLYTEAMERLRRQRDNKEVGEKRKVQRTLSVDKDLPIIRQSIEANPEVALLVLDPMSSYWGAADDNKSKEIRPVLDKMTALCRDTDLTIVGLIHHSKRSDTDALGKVLGSVSVGGAARAVWEISKDPDDPQTIRMALVKGNLAKKRSGMTYHIEGKDLVIDGETSSVPHIVWDGVMDANADELLDQQRERGREKREGGATTLAKAFLTMKLENGAAQSSGDDGLIEEAKRSGISSATLWRVKKDLDIRASRQGGEWYWSLPSSRLGAGPSVTPNIGDVM